MSASRARGQRPPSGGKRREYTDRHPSVVQHTTAPHGSDISVDGRDSDDHVGFERLIFFSDAVFAIAITLLVIDIRLPDNAGNDLSGALRHLMPNFLGFIISFLVIAVYWMAHHRAFRRIRRYDGGLIWINTLILMTVAFLPFSTSLMSSYGDSTTAVDFYAVNLILTSALFMLMWIYAVASGRLTDARPPREERIQTAVRLAVPIVVILASIAIAQWSTDMAKYAWLTIPIFQSAVPALFMRASPTESTSAGPATQ